MVESTVDESLAMIKRSGIIAILRGDFDGEQLVRIGEVLQRNGVLAIEVTLNTPSAERGIGLMRDRLAGEILLGAGTVRTRSDVERALNAGAQFLVSPNLDEESVTLAREKGALHLPGVFTATEIQRAVSMQCSAVKLFPASVGGAAYLRALRAPLDDVLFVPVGGIDVGNAAEFARSGALAIGVGSSLVKGPNQDVAELAETTKRFVEAWNEGRRDR